MTELQNFSLSVTPQAEPIPGAGQVRNSAGGHSWQVLPWTRLRRFLILGSEGGSYYASARRLTTDNIDGLLTCLAEDPRRYLREVVEVSESGRAPKNDPAIFALALALARGDDNTRRIAGEMLPRVCRTGTHLLQFAQFSSGLRGWGRGLRRAVAGWYERADLDRLALQMVKYRSRVGYTHRDLLRLSHPRTSAQAVRFPDAENLARGDIYDWACGRVTLDNMSEAQRYERLPRIIIGFELARRVTDPSEAASLVREYQLTHECLPSSMLAHAEVWEALLEHMPIHALVRNLARMTANGLLTSQSDATTRVVHRLGDWDAIVRARLHPLAVLSALKTYQQGHGERGRLSWRPVTRIVDALDSAFYGAFGSVEAVGNRKMLALDVSGSMDWGDIAGMPGLTPRIAAAALSLITAAVEPNHEIMAFSHELVPLTISPKCRLDSVIRMTSRLAFGGTDCALPMLYAAKNKLEIDTFVVYTDSETWCGHVHPAQALKRYREQSGIAARLVVVGMVANEFSIADPSDSGMLDVVGFDTATPQLIADFESGRI